jgi:hypothetical protein
MTNFVELNDVGKENCYMYFTDEKKYEKDFWDCSTLYNGFY